MNTQDLDTLYQQGKIEGQLDFFTLELTRGNQNLVLHFHNNGAQKVLNETLNRYDLVTQMQWLGQTFDFVGMSMDGIQFSDGGRVNTPTLTVSNSVNGQDGYITALCMITNNLKGAKLTRHTTLKQLYDAGNYQYYTQVWYIERKSDATGEMVKFLLKSPLDYRKQKIPTRMISNYCTWAMRGEYRGEVCGYTGTKYFDEYGNPVTDISKDVCGGLCTDCELRFGKGARLPHGGFIAAFDNGNY